MASKRESAETQGLETSNEVRLVGRVSTAPAERELPSGDRLTTFRVVVDRPARRGAPRRVDALDCAAWTARVRKGVSGWTVGDVVEVHGAMRRRFYRAGAGVMSTVEIEVTSARRRARALSRGAPASRAAPRRRAPA